MHQNGFIKPIHEGLSLEQRILELLKSDHRSHHRQIIARQLDTTSTKIDTPIKMLMGKGMIERPKRGYYKIADKWK